VRLSFQVTLGLQTYKSLNLEITKNRGGSEFLSNYVMRIKNLRPVAASASGSLLKDKVTVYLSSITARPACQKMSFVIACCIEEKLHLTKTSTN
jgi:hypothetical protein